MGFDDFVVAYVNMISADLKNGRLRDALRLVARMKEIKLQVGLNQLLK